MRRLGHAGIAVAAVALVSLSGARAAEVEEVKACQARQLDVAKQADAFSGDPMIKKLIEADLRRSTRELIEGDAVECNEALDHATKLLKGET